MKVLYVPFTVVEAKIEKITKCLKDHVLVGAAFHGLWRKTIPVVAWNVNAWDAESRLQFVHYPEEPWKISTLRPLKGLSRCVNRAKALLWSDWVWITIGLELSFIWSQHAPCKCLKGRLSLIWFIICVLAICVGVVLVLAGSVWSALPVPVSLRCGTDGFNIAEARCRSSSAPAVQ